MNQPASQPSIAPPKKPASTITVINSGRGISGGSHPDGGLGLANIRERLEAIYGRRARLILEENRPSGIKATIEVPYEVV